MRDRKREDRMLRRRRRSRRDDVPWWTRVGGGGHQGAYLKGRPGISRREGWMRDELPGEGR